MNNSPNIGYVDPHAEGAGRDTLRDFAVLVNLSARTRLAFAKKALSASKAEAARCPSAVQPLSQNTGCRPSCSASNARKR